MRISTRNPVHRVREYLLVRDLAALTDAELLAKFIATRDEDAFTAIVRRHSSLVLGTARRILHDASDADDVFQACFLTLARKANSLRCDGSLAAWLHRVTFRLALRARKRSRPVAGEPRLPHPGDDPLEKISGRELWSAIDEELARLSTGLRAPVVLCCLQGMTRDEAAAELGWSTATLKRRLALARAILERRLTARGVTLAAALAPAVLSASLLASACAGAVGATIETVLGRSPLSARVSLLCTSSAGVLTSRFAMIAASGLIAASVLVGFQTPKGSSPPTPPAAGKSGEGAVADAYVDPLPPGAAARIGTTRFRHDEWVNHAVWSPDGKLIASAAGKTVVVWESESGREVHRQTLKDSDFVEAKKRNWPSQVESMEWSPDGKSFLTVFNGFTQHWIWDGAKRELRFVQAYANGVDQPFLASRFTGDRYMVSATISFLQVTDLVKKEPLHQVPIPAGRKLRHAVVSPDGKTAVAALSGDRDELCLFDLLKERAPLVTILDRRATNLTFSGDGKTFADVIQDAEKNTVIEIWNTTRWEKPQRWTYPRPDDGVVEIRALALSPDGKTLVTGASDHTLRWWNTTTGKETRKIGPGWVYFNRAAFRPDGKVLMTASHENHIRLWDVQSGKELPVTHGPGWTMAAVAWTPDGKRVLSVSENSVYIHDAATGRELWRGGEHTDTAVQVVVTPDGKSAISSGNDGRVIFREIESGKVIRTIENPRHSVDTLALSGDGQTLTGLGTEPPHDGVLLRWDVRDGKAYKPSSLPAKDSLYVANALIPTPDGSGIAVSSGTELRVPVFSPSGKELRAAYGPTDGGVRCAAYSPDGRCIAAASLAGTIYIWETATGQERLVLKDAVQTTCLAFSPDGRIVAVANDDKVLARVGDKTVRLAQDRTVVRLLDAYTGREFHRFAGHTGSVYRLAWSSDGRRLLSGSYDASCLIWDVTPAVRAKLPAKVLDERAATKEAELLASANATEAYAAMAKLTGSPSTTVPAMRTTLKPIVAPDKNKLTALIRDLDSPQFSVREKAASQLLRTGDGVEGPLRTALAGQLSTEARERIEKLLGELKPSSDRLRQSRGLEVLQRIGDAQAKKLLAEISNGADGAWLTREAKSALDRIYPES